MKRRKQKHMDFFTVAVPFDQRGLAAQTIRLDCTGAIVERFTDQTAGYVKLLVTAAPGTATPMRLLNSLLTRGVNVGGDVTKLPRARVLRIERSDLAEDRELLAHEPQHT